MLRYGITICLFSICGSTLADTSEQEKAQDSKEQAEEKEKKAQRKAPVETVYILGQKNQMRTEAGSAHFLNDELLEKFEYNDIHRILSQVPGVHFREEDGYGLRPNIGIRGATTERSQKIALMEDGILIAPAPYSAPAAYFFPLTTRMQAVEVFKGPATIKYGPNTIGGAINMVSRSIPDQASGQVDFSLSSNQMSKVHAYGGNSGPEFSWLVEGIHWETEGFKELQNGESTGFDKNEFIAKGRWVPTFGGDIYHQFDINFGVSEEISNETYLGLTDSDFNQNPYQRYAASQLDQMDWAHSKVILTHLMEWENGTNLISKFYRLDLERAWQKFNRFNTGVPSRSIGAILASPNAGVNATLYDVLRGVADSLSPAENLMIGTNDREYFSHGVQTELNFDFDWVGMEHALSLGLRLHQDGIKRFHTEDTFSMQGGQLVAVDISPTAIEVDNDETASSLALFIQDEIQWDNWRVNLGLRTEAIRSESEKFRPVQLDKIENDFVVVLPGIGTFYQINDNFGFLAGVYRGFVPNNPGQVDAEPELSVNYELGVRGIYDNFKYEAVGFFSDYSNLIGVCTFSAGCVDDVDSEFNGGEVHIGGLELNVSQTWELGAGLSLPVGLVYTFTESAFQTAFESDFSQWGEVKEGDALPYLPKHQLTLSLGVESDAWSFQFLSKYTSEMRETAGVTDTALDGQLTEELWLLDAVSSYAWDDRLRVYFNIDNLLDEQAIISRRPFGARPTMPRNLQLGFKYAF